MRLVAFDMGSRNFAWSIVSFEPRTPVSAVVVDRFDLQPLDPENLYRSLHQYLESNEHHFSDCSVILVEQQMKINIQALKLSQHVLAFFMIRHPTKTILEYSASNKTRILGIETSTKKERKQATVDYTTALLEHDPVMGELFHMLRKKDDVADCVMMCISYGCRFSGLAL
jgi:hypothetical protein